jgi:hypothetical protein
VIAQRREAFPGVVVWGARFVFGYLGQGETAVAKRRKAWGNVQQAVQMAVQTDVHTNPERLRLGLAVFCA